MSDAIPNSRALGREALSAFLLYLTLSVLFFGRGLVSHFSTWHVGRGPDPIQLIWHLAWWAYAIRHGANPFLTKLLFAPVGTNLTWTVIVPLAALMVLPITWSCGPVAAYNIVCLLGPALAGWAAFVLCHWITCSYWPSIAGGWVFGFSTYIVCALLTHFNLALVFPVPLMMWLVLRRLHREISPGRFVAGLGILIAAQFLFFPEIAASASFVGALAFLLALALVAGEVRRSLVALVAPILAAYAVAVVLLSPYLYYMFAFGHSGGSVLDPTLLGADLVSFLIPTAVNELGKPYLMGAISSTYLATLAETASYLALPLIAIAVWFARSRFREPVGRILIELLVILCLLALGSRVVIAGHPTIAAPWMLLLQFPLLNKIVPIRLMAYAFLVLAIIVAMWLSSDDVRPSHKWVLGLALVPFMLPNLSARFWKTPFDIPPFFSTSLYRQYLAPDEIVMALPNPIYGDGMQWQLATDMYFRLAGGYIPNRAIRFENLRRRSPRSPDLGIRRSEDHQLRDPERRRDMRRTRIVPRKEGGIAHQLHHLAKRRSRNGAPRRKPRKVFTAPPDENCFQPHGLFEMARQFQKMFGRPRLLRRCGQRMNHRVRGRVGRIPRAAWRWFNPRPRNLRNRHAQIEHRGRHMLRRVHAARNSQRLLRGGDGGVIDPTRAEDFESGPEPGARQKREPGAACPAMQVHAKRGSKGAERTRARRQNRFDVVIVLKHGGKSIFHDDANPQIGTRVLKKVYGRRRQHAISQGTEPYDSHAAAGTESFESIGLPGHVRFCHSSIVASSINMTGISSRIG